MTTPATPPSRLAPAPWTLHGKGFVLLYRFSTEWLRQYGFLADYQRTSLKVGLGAVMLVDYQTSGVGPYRELLFIPGIFRLNQQWTYSISKIYVSSYDSVWNGIENWGIPKELADFEWHTTDQLEHIRVSLDSGCFFEAKLRASAAGFPINTRFFPLKVTQQLRHKSILTRPSARGKGGFGQLKYLSANAASFPPLHELKPLAVLSVRDFEMIFPVPHISPLF